MIIINSDNDDDNDNRILQKGNFVVFYIYLFPLLQQFKNGRFLFSISR